MIDLAKIETTVTVVPEGWDYDESVEKVKTFVYKWKNITTEMLDELLVAREVLAKRAEHAGRPKEGCANAQPYSWGQYCQDIGSTQNTVNRWLAQHLAEIEGEPKTKTPVFYLTEPRHQAIINQIDIMIDMMDVRTCVEVPISLMRMELDKLKKSINQLTVK